MSWTRRWTRSLTQATLGLAVAAGLACWMLWQAIAIAALPSALPTTKDQGFPLVATRAPTPPALRRSAVEANPFRPERGPAALAFRMPSDQADTPVVSIARSPLRLIGTAVLPGNRGFAMCQVGSETPKLVRLGEQVGGYTLTAVAQGAATFTTTTGTTLDLQVPKAGTLHAN